MIRPGALLTRVLRPFRLVRHFGADEDGAATVEFCILFPAFVAIFLSSFESGLMMVRNVMLERGLDIAVRDLRLGTPNPPSFDEFKQTICDNAILISDCDTSVLVELRPVSTTTWGPLTPAPLCLDIESALDPIDQTEYSVGTNNELMLVRVCALFEVLFPTTRWGLQMPEFDEGRYALVSTTAFVNEPSR